MIQTRYRYAKEALFLSRRTISLSPRLHARSKGKNVDIDTALSDTSRLLEHGTHTNGTDEDDEIITNRRTRKIDMRFTHDIQNKVLTVEERRAVKREERRAIKKEEGKSMEPAKDEDKGRRKPKRRISAQDVLRGINKGVMDNLKMKNEAEPKQQHSSDEPVTKQTSSKPYKDYDADRRKPVFSATIDVNDSSLMHLGMLNKDKIPKLAHNLDKALFSPGVHFLQDPRTRVYNFPPFLKKIMEYKDFNVDAIPPFVTVSKDENVKKLAIKHKKKYYSSTSSMTATMVQFYFFLNNYSFKTCERFDFEVMNGMLVSRPAVSMIRKRSDNLYSVEADKSADSEILLSAMGHCLEALLTTEEAEFKRRYDKKNKGKEQISDLPESAYNYSSYGNFLMRSQLDCIDPQLPGNGTFDIKTRAAVSVRNNSRDPNVSSNKYQIWKLTGEYESFEKEFKDLVRTGALLKYLFQARIGQMDGIYLAYHNVNTFFGFQYLPIETLDNLFYNNKTELEYAPEMTNTQLRQHFKSADDLCTRFAETQFKMTLKIWEHLLGVIEQDIPDSSYRLVMKSQRIKSRTYLNVYAIEVTDKDMAALQTFSKNYETSFRHNFSPERLNKNLNEHLKDLEKFNTQMVERSRVFEYTIDLANHMINGVPISGSHQVYPRSIKTDWQVKINIHKSKESSEIIKQGCLKMLSAVTETIDTPSPKNDDKISRERRLDIYTMVGEDREAEWREKDEKEVVYSMNRS